MTDHTEPDAVDELLDKWERDAQDTIRGYKAMGGKEPHESRRVLRLIAAVRKYREATTATTAGMSMDDYEDLLAEAEALLSGEESAPKKPGLPLGHPWTPHSCGCCCTECAATEHSHLPIPSESQAVVEYTPEHYKPATPEAAPSETSSSARTTLRTKLSEAEANLAAVHHVLGESEHSDDSTLAEGVSLRLRELEAKLSQTEKELTEARFNWANDNALGREEEERTTILVTSLVEALEQAVKNVEAGGTFHGSAWMVQARTALSQAREKGAGEQ